MPTGQRFELRCVSGASLGHSFVVSGWGKGLLRHQIHPPWAIVAPVRRFRRASHRHPWIGQSALLIWLRRSTASSVVHTVLAMKRKFTRAAS